MIAGILVVDRYTPVEKSPVKVSNTNGSPERTFWIMKSKKKRYNNDTQNERRRKA